MIPIQPNHPTHNEDAENHRRASELAEFLIGLTHGDDIAALKTRWSAFSNSQDNIWPWKVGDVPIPGYELLERIGQGTFGQVWKADHRAGPVAVKLIANSAIDEWTELDALRQLGNVRHPNLMKPTDYDQNEQWLVICMPLVDGDMSRLYDDARMSGRNGVDGHEVAKHFLQVAPVIDLLGANNLAHCDIKPQNLLFHGDTVYLADFGIVHRIDETRPSIYPSSESPYMAPELLRGAPTASSDQFSLAVTYCGLTTGCLPFLHGAHATSVAPNLSMLPPDEREVIKKALDPVPSQRWSSCRDFARNLEGSTRERILRVDNFLLPKMKEERVTKVDEDGTWRTTRIAIPIEVDGEVLMFEQDTLSWSCNKTREQVQAEYNALMKAARDRTLAQRIWVWVQSLKEAAISGIRDRLEINRILGRRDW